MDYSKEIQGIVEKVLVEKTFSLDIVNKIKELKDGFDGLTEKNKSLSEINSRQDEKISMLSMQKEKLSKQISEYESREIKIIAKEKELYKKEQEAENERKLKDLAVDLFKTVFRNTEVRRGYSKSIPFSSQNGSYPTIVSESGGETETKE